MKKARIFNIERFATDDGGGIRTVVFFKGCTLRCEWCANPESQQYKKEVLFLAQRCKNCGKCVQVCPVGAIKKIDNFGYISQDDLCTRCGKCIDLCCFSAREMMGEDISVADLVEEIIKDEKYYKMSGGGVTLSGGEPLLQIDFIKELAIELKKRKIHIIVETCGKVLLETIKQCEGLFDEIFYDIKNMNEENHILHTEGTNKDILENLFWLCDNFSGKLVIRYPYIPGYNDSEEDIIDFLSMVKSKEKIKKVRFLPYHRLGLPKYNGLGRHYKMGDMPSLKINDVKFLCDKSGEFGIDITVE